MQLGDSASSMLHIDLNPIDSMYKVQINHIDSVHPIDKSYSGKYRIDEDGRVKLLGDSPFVNDELQIVVLRSRSSLFAEIKFNKKYAEIFTHKKLHAYCEINFTWDLQDCIVPY
ncbi:MAG: hypothetical protein R2809_10960 [Flavobacteriales bacterium]